MNQPNIIQADCVLPPCQTAGGSVQSPSPISLLLQPDPAFVNVWGIWTYAAILTMSDGSTQDVTALAVWDSSSLGVVSLDANVATGVSAGVATIAASYGGLQAFSQISVVAACQDSGVEVTLCLGRDTAMNLHEDGTPRIDFVRTGVTQLISNTRTATDKVAIVSFGGRRISTNPNKYQSEATIDAKLTNDLATLSAALVSYKVRQTIHPQGTLDGVIGIGGGLSLAFAEATSGRHTDGLKRVVVLVVDGRDAVGSPVPATVAASIKSAGISLVIIGIAIPDDYSSVLRSMASTALYFGVSKASDSAGIIARVPHAFCDTYSFDMPATPYDDTDGGGVGKSDQTISFDQPVDQKVGNADFSLHANASSALAVTFSVVSGPATLTGSTLHLTGAGFVTVRASQAGNTVYNAAPNVDRTFWVYASTAVLRIVNYRDGLIGDCTLCPTPSSNPSWDGAFKFVSAMPTSYWISTNPDQNTFSINGRAFFEGVIVPIGGGKFGLWIYCYDAAADFTRRLIWHGESEATGVETGVYTRQSDSCATVPNTVRVDVV